MRKGTQALVSILSLGVVAAGYQAGQAVEVSNFASAAAPAPAPVAVEASSTPASTPSAPDSTAPAPASTPKATSSASSAAPAPVAPVTPVAPAPVTTPKATQAPAPAPASGGTTKTGSAVPYRFGTVQVSVTKANGKITAVNLLQAGATGGRESAFSYLVDLAIQANGTSFGNLGGATYTVDAFKQSLESALAKF